MKTIDINDLQVKLARQFMKHVKGRNLPLLKSSAEALRAIADTGTGTFTGEVPPASVMTVHLADPGIEAEAGVRIWLNASSAVWDEQSIRWTEPPVVELSMVTSRRCRDMQGHSASSATFERQCIDTLKLLEKMTNDALEGGIDGTLCVSCKVKTPG